MLTWRSGLYAKFFLIHADRVRLGKISLFLSDGYRVRPIFPPSLHFLWNCVHSSNSLHLPHRARSDETLSADAAARLRKSILQIL